MKTVIAVWNCRAAVSRHVQIDSRTWTTQAAANWEALEDDAIKEVDAAGGAINLSGHYPISDELASRAIFNEVQP